ncbi:MAG TPA: hypothetical protein VFL57_04615, partial [Bryobacteraceae bacterium]|nr:hypothetical protein [Bryobacteraceae bacterium]
MIRSFLIAALVAVTFAAGATGQALPPGFPPPRPLEEAKPAPTPGQQPAPQPAKPEQPNKATLEAEQKNIPATLPAATTGGLNLQNASLTEVIDVLARQLKINYILDPRVKGSVTINT